MTTQRRKFYTSSDGDGGTCAANAAARSSCRMNQINPPEASLRKLTSARSLPQAIMVLSINH